MAAKSSQSMPLPTTYHFCRDCATILFNPAHELCGPCAAAEDERYLASRRGRYSSRSVIRPTRLARTPLSASKREG